TNGKLVSVVLHGTDVRRAGSKATGCQYRYIVQQVVGGFMKVVVRKRQLAIEEREVESSIRLFGSFPYEILVANVGDTESGEGPVLKSARCQWQLCIIADTVLISGFTPA